MRQYFQPERILSVVAIILTMIGCRAAEEGAISKPQTSLTAEIPNTITLDPPQESFQVNPTVPTMLTEPISTPVTVPDTGWQFLKPGLERRLLTVQQEGAGVPEKFYMLRIDNNQYNFDVGYHPGEPQRLVDWLNETGALIVVNGGYFTESWEATGAVIVDGQPYGTSFRGFGGMLTITEGNLELRWLTARPYDGQEPITDGLQSFPMLVVPGNQIGYPEEDGIPARRTVIAQDRQGRFLFVLASSGTFTLHQLSRFLVASDLDLELALNLDGGSSTGLLLADPAEGIPPFTLLPIVITIHPR